STAAKWRVTKPRYRWLGSIGQRFLEREEVVDDRRLQLQCVTKLLFDDTLAGSLAQVGQQLVQHVGKAILLCRASRLRPDQLGFGIGRIEKTGEMSIDELILPRCRGR